MPTLVRRSLLLLLALLPLRGHAQQANANRVVVDPVLSAPPLVLRDTAQAYALSPRLELLADEPATGAAALGIAQVLRPPYVGRFRRSSDSIPNARGNGLYWLRWRLHNAHPRPVQWLLMMGAFSTSLDLYTVDSAGHLLRAQELDPDHSWSTLHSLPAHRYNIALAVPPGQTRTFYLCTYPGIFNFQVYERTHLLQQFRQWDIWETLFYGTFLMLAVYNSLLYLSVRDRSYLFYVLYAASFALLQARYTGYLRHWFSAWFTSRLDNICEYVLLSATLFFGILTARSFMETWRHAPRLDELLRIMLVISVVPLAEGLLPGEWENGLNIAVPLLVCGTLLAAGVAVALAGYRPARYYIAGWTLLLLAVFAYYLRSMGLLPVSFFTEYGVRITSAFDVILLSLGLAARLNLARAQRLQALLDGQAQERRRISQEMHDDLGAGLTSIMYLSHALQGPPAQAGPAATRIGEAAGQLSAKMNEVIWTLNDAHDTLESLVQYLRLHTAELLDNAGLDYNFDIDDNLPDVPVSKELRRNLYLVVREAVHNAVKHAAGRSVTLAIHCRDGGLRVEVQDDGRGLPGGDSPTGRPFGNGLANMRQRMAQLGGRLRFETTENGTCVHLWAPLAG